MKKSSFQDFLSKFPPVSMPITLGEDTHHTFSTENEPLSAEMISTYVSPNEEEDEFTEYVPCFSIEGTEPFEALVWWKASLLSYEYVLAIFTPVGEEMSRNVIAGARVENNLVFRAVATINEDWEIAIAEGVSPDGNHLFDPGSSVMRHLEILSNGAVVGG